MRDARTRTRINRLERELPPQPPPMRCFSENHYPSRDAMRAAVEEWERETGGLAMVVFLETEAEREARQCGKA